MIEAAQARRTELINEMATPRPPRPQSAVDRMLIDMGFDLAASDQQIERAEQERQQRDELRQEAERARHTPRLNTVPREAPIGLPKFVRTTWDRAERETRERYNNGRSR